MPLTQSKSQIKKNFQKKMEKVLEVEEKWRDLWSEALLIWSKYINLKNPSFYRKTEIAIKNGVKDTFAQISLADLGTQFDLEKIVDYGLEDYALPIMCHEIGHHVLFPGNISDFIRAYALITPIFGDKTRANHMQNLYGDLLINDKLYTSRNLPVADVYRLFYKNLGTNGSDSLWIFYLRVYETLWRLPRGDLVGDPSLITQRMDIDAGIAVRILRVFENQHFIALKKLSYVFLSYFPPYNEINQFQMPVLDTESIGDLDLDKLGDHLSGMSKISEDELCAINEGELDAYSFDTDYTEEDEVIQSKTGQNRSVAQLHKIYRDLGLDVPMDQITIQYYSELASPHLISFPSKVQPMGNSLLEGTERWFFGDPLDEVDWMATVFESPHVIPGLTTRKLVYGPSSGNENRTSPLWLDLYIDCSGSMPNPQNTLSYLTLAGTIMALSALRAGAKVQVTLWSNYGKYKTTRPDGGGPLSGFLEDKYTILEYVTGFINGGTGFPLNILRDTYQNFPEDDEIIIHIMSISDDGIDTILQKDEYGTLGKEIVEYSLEKAKGGGTQLLHLYNELGTYKWNKTLSDLGFDLYKITDWKELLEFSTEFSQKTYSDNQIKNKT